MKVYVTIKKCEVCDDFAILEVNSEEILSGDYYHNKIDERIEGFLEGLKYCSLNICQFDIVETTDDDYCCENCQWEKEWEEDEESED